MTLLVGALTTTSHGTVGNGTQNIQYGAIWTAVATGSATTMSVGLNSTNTGNLVLAIYDSTGATLLGYTNPFAQATGVNTHSLVSPVSIVSGTQYLLTVETSGFYIDANNNGAGTFVDPYNYITYSSPPPATFALSTYQGNGYPSLSADGTTGITLTGESATNSAGSAVPGTTLSLSGINTSGSQGTVGVSVTKTLTGRGITGSLGIMGVVGQHGLGANLYEGASTPNNTITLSGLTVGSAAGLVSANGDVTVSLAGLGMASAEGFVTPSGGALVVGLTGLATTSSEGTFGVSLVINPANDINITLVGLAAALSEGSFSTSLSAGLPSALLTSYAGTVNAISGLVIPITGLLGTFTEGAFTPAKTGTLTGLSSQAAYGIITFNEKGGMPNLYGLNYYEAQNALQAVGIYVPVPAFAFQPPQITVEWVQSDQPGGLVVAQSPAYGSAVKPGAPVTLTISIFDVGSIIE